MRSPLLYLRRHQPDEGPGEYGEVIARIGGVRRLARPRAAPQAVHPNIGIAQLREPDAGQGDSLDVRIALLRAHAQAEHGLAKTGDVVVQPEETPLPHARNVICDVRTAIAPIGNGNSRFRQGHEMIVYVCGTAEEALALEASVRQRLGDFRRSTHVPTSLSKG